MGVRSTFDPSLNIDGSCLRGTFRRDKSGRFVPRSGGELEETLAQRLAHAWHLSPTDNIHGHRLDARSTAELRRMLRFSSREEWEAAEADRAELVAQHAEARRQRDQEAESEPDTNFDPAKLEAALNPRHGRGCSRRNPWTRGWPDGSMEVRFCRGRGGRFLPNPLLNPAVGDMLYPWEISERLNPPGFQLQGRSEEVLNLILERFKDPASLPTPLSQVFVRNEATHASRLSLMNQFIIAMHGESEAMGFQQWKEHGRSVKKGGKGMAILAPLARSIEVENEAGEKDRRTIIKGFEHVVVFGLSQTEGDPYQLAKDDGFLGSLPFLDVAAAWGVRVTTYTGGGKHLGYFSPDQKTIALGVKNASTFAHELTRAADHRLGQLNIEKYGKDKRAKADAEVVAELGGATLLAAVGQAEAADLGGAYEYLKSWSPEGDARVAAFRVLDRVLKAVQLVIAKAQRLANVEPTAEAPAASPSAPAGSDAGVSPAPSTSPALLISAPSPVAPAAAVPAGGRQLTIWDNPGPRLRKITRAEVRQWWSGYGDAAARDLAAARSTSEVGVIRDLYRLTTGQERPDAPTTATARFNFQVKQAMWNELNHRVHGSTIVSRYPWGGDLMGGPLASAAASINGNPPPAVVGLGVLVALVVRQFDGQRVRITPQDERWLAWRAATQDLLVLRPGSGPAQTAPTTAARGHRTFHGAAPQGTRQMSAPQPGRGLRTVGLLESLTYTAAGISSPSKRGHDWIHHFGDTGERGHGPTRRDAHSPYAERVMPALAVNAAGDLFIQRLPGNRYTVRDWVLA